jgi:hypothetical protein
MAIQPGASTSVSDVYTGLVGGLKELGHEIIYYQLDTRIARAGAWLNFSWEEAKKKNPDVVEPTTADILFQACGMSIPIALLKKPDWVIVVSSMYYPKLFLKMLKQAGMNLALLLTESPYDDEEQYSLAAVADVVWTNERTSLDNTATRGLPSQPMAKSIFVMAFRRMTLFSSVLDLKNASKYSSVSTGTGSIWDCTVHGSFSAGIPRSRNTSAMKRSVTIWRRRYTARQRSGLISTAHPKVSARTGRR